MRRINKHAEVQGYGAPTWGSNRLRTMPQVGSPSSGSGFTPLHRSVVSAVPG